MDEDQDVQAARDYVLGLCSAIGGYEDVKQEDGTLKRCYSVGDEALGCLKDLKRAIRIDSQSNEKVVLNTLTEFNLIEHDIVPLILSFRNHPDTEVANRFILACTELLVPMTWPIEQSLDDEQEDDDPNMLFHQRKYKLGLMVPEVYEAIMNLILTPLSVPYRERSGRDNTIIKLVLYLFRNLSVIPDFVASQMGTHEQLKMAHMQENYVICLYESQMMELLLTIASNTSTLTDYSEWNVLVMEIFYNLLKHIDPKDVFLSDYRSEETGDINDASKRLSQLLVQDNEHKRQKISANPPRNTRHNRFGGTYIIESDAGTRKITHKQEGGFAELNKLLDEEKKNNNRGRKRQLENEYAIQKVYQNRKALTYIKQTARSFLETCFNALYSSILKDIHREDMKIVEKDYTRYYYTMRWFLEYFSYEHKASMKRRESELDLPGQVSDEVAFDYDLVATALELKTILFSLQRIRTRMEEKAWFDVRVTVDFFRQILLTVNDMSKSKIQEYRDVAEHIQSNLYYEQSTLDLFSDLIRRYTTQSIEYLKSVVVLNHVLLRLLEHYAKSKKVLFVRKKQAPKKKKVPVETLESMEEGSTAVVNNADEEGEEISEDEDEAKERRLAYKEHVFTFESFERKYLTYDVVIAYCTLLEHYKNLKPEYITYITTMFHRIMVKRGIEYPFFKLPVLDLFDRILTDANALPETDAHAQLFKFIQHALRQFFDIFENHSLLLVEALVPTIHTSKAMWVTDENDDISDLEESELNELTEDPMET
ncbi:timeless protein-domain-containing protein [Pilobolus umbonatus]|nr:timeless protein-domain-containing protein [Pilobolus umbonatus]